VEYSIFGTSDRETITSRITPYLIRRTDGPTSSLGAGILLAGFTIFFIALFLLMQFVKRPIKGVIDDQPKDDFNKVHDFTDEMNGE